MIGDVDATLKELLVSRVPIDLSDIDIRFELPSKDWAAGVTRPTINLFLYDMRENHELRSNQRFLSRSDDKRAGTETRAPVRIDLTYLVTAWATEVADEHELLGRVLSTLLRFPTLPVDVLRGAMQAQSLPVQAWIAQPERMPNPWEFWGHVDHGMKAGLNFVLTAALEPYAATTEKLVARTRTDLEQVDR